MGPLLGRWGMVMDNETVAKLLWSLLRTNDYAADFFEEVEAAIAYLLPSETKTSSPPPKKEE